MHGQISQHLTVNVHMGLFDTVDEPAVGNTMDPGSGINTGNPELAEIPFTDPSVTICIFHGPVGGLRGRPEETAPGAKEPFGHLQNLSSLLLRRNGSFHSWHVLSPFSQ
jgi:hypothetical protein